MSAHLVLLGDDYHLGDLLWLTAVLDLYRQRIAPERMIVACPDRPLNRILERAPMIDDLLYGPARTTLPAARARYGDRLTLIDLRPLPLARAMLRDPGYRLPWLYLRDLWLRERGQWLATYLRLGRLPCSRPLLALRDEDRAPARDLPEPYIVLAPHCGRYDFAPLDRFWRTLKGWDGDEWRRLARRVRAAGYTPVTLGAPGERPVAGTLPLLGLPIAQAAAVIEGAAALVSAESGLWYLAAAAGTPFVIVPWWLPRGIDWAASMGVPHRLAPRRDARAELVYALVEEVIAAGDRRARA